MEPTKSRTYHLPRSTPEPEEVFEVGDRVVEVTTKRVYTIKSRTDLNFYFVEELEGFFVAKQLSRADS